GSHGDEDRRDQEQQLDDGRDDLGREVYGHDERHGGRHQITDRRRLPRQALPTPSFSRMSRVTSAPSALPFVSFMTAPTSAPTACTLPPRICSTAPPGLASMTRSTIASSSPESAIAPSPFSSTIAC